METPDKNELTLWRRINLIFRFSYTLPFVLASVCGIVAALPYGAPWYILVLIPVTVLFMALFVNFSNDYFDYKSGIDAKVFHDRFEVQRKLLESDALKKLYWSGNQFDTGLVTEKQGKAIMAALVVIIVILAIPILLYGGWAVLVMGAVGLFLAWAYTAPPINLGARGLGEVDVMVSFFMMCFCSFYIVAGTMTVDVALFSVMVGLIVGLMRLIDSMPANAAHREAGEINLSIRLGDRGSFLFIEGVVVFAYILVLAMCLFNAIYVILFLSLPLTSRMIRVMRSGIDHWDVEIIPYSFGFSVTSEVLFIIAAAVTYFTGAFPLI